jgi:hypothetical protein
MEISIRNLLPQYDPRGNIEFYKNDEGVPLAVRSGRLWRNTGDFNVAVNINKYGLRDYKDLVNSKKEDIFTVGDSFSFGYGVEENERYSNILEHLSGINVYNISIPAIAIEEYEKLINYAKNSGAPIKKLIIGICMENDFESYGLSKEFIEIYNKNRKRYTSPLFKFRVFLQKSSATYTALTVVIHNTPWLKDLFINWGIIIDTVAYRPIATFEAVREGSNRLESIAAPYDVIVLIIPARYLWLPAEKERQLKERQVHELFVSLMKRRKIPVVDMKEVFESNGNPLNFYFRLDGHWTKEAHIIAANELAKKIKKLRWY